MWSIVALAPIITTEKVCLLWLVTGGNLKIVSALWMRSDQNQDQLKILFIFNTTTVYSIIKIFYLKSGAQIAIVYIAHEPRHTAHGTMVWTANQLDNIQLLRIISTDDSATRHRGDSQHDNWILVVNQTDYFESNFPIF